DPEGGAQEVRRFSLAQDVPSKNPGARFDLARELWRSVFLWLLSFDAYQKKVTRPLADGSCCCCFHPHTHTPRVRSGSRLTPLLQKAHRAETEAFVVGVDSRSQLAQLLQRRPQHLS
ncbi:hypothetical protein, partial [Lysobacter silvisoli]|uniref:hypothetical protein n=1 Tax=Lysobacter silvisoli TaxID=2293254 RepID=UPI001E3CC019